MLDTEKVEELRKAAGLTQEEAAARAGLPSKAYWNDIVKGRKANVTMDMLDKIAKALGVHPRELVK